MVPRWPPHVCGKPIVEQQFFVLERLGGNQRHTQHRTLFLVALFATCAGKIGKVAAPRVEVGCVGNGERSLQDVGCSAFSWVVYQVTPRKGMAGLW